MDSPIQLLASLKPEDGLRYVKARLDEGATAGTVRREWQVLNLILNVGVRYEKLDRNSLKHVELPDADKRTRNSEPSELSLISEIRKNDPTQARIPAIALAHYSGGRLGRCEKGRSWRSSVRGLNGGKMGIDCVCHQLRSVSKERRRKLH